MRTNQRLLRPQRISCSVWSAALLVTVVVGVQLLGPGVRVGVFVILGLWALTSPLGAIQALTLSWLITFLNPGLFEGSDLDVLLRWLVLGLAAIRAGVELLLRRQRGLSRPIVILIVFAAVATAISVARSYALEISLLRATTFTVGAGTIFLCFQLNRSGRGHLENWFLGLAVVLVLGALPLIAHELGYVRNGRGFQGLLSHPQSYGIFLAPVAAWGTAVIAVGGLSRPKLWILVTLASWVSLFGTQSRTALLGAAGGLLVGATLVIPGSAPLRRHLRNRLLRLRPILLGCAALGGLAVYGTEVQGALREFATKGQREVPVAEVFELSRGAMVAASWSNFEERPVFGTGFGLASDPRELDPSYVPGVPVPVGASVEKGFLPTTVLEEVGLVGTGVFLLLILSIIRPVVSTGNLGAAVLVLSALLVNLGEMIFFALGGMGLYMWLMVGFGYHAARGEEPSDLLAEHTVYSPRSPCAKLG